MRYSQTGREIENNSNLIVQQTENVIKIGRSFNFVVNYRKILFSIEKIGHVECVCKLTKILRNMRMEYRFFKWKGLLKLLKQQFILL